MKPEYPAKPPPNPKSLATFSHAPARIPTRVLYIVYLYFYLGDPLQACAAADELQMKLKEFAGIPVDSSDTKSLALISFLYLYCAITGKDG